MGKLVSNTLHWVMLRPTQHICISLTMNRPSLRLMHSALRLMHRNSMSGRVDMPERTGPAFNHHSEATP